LARRFGDGLLGREDLETPAMDQDATTLDPTTRLDRGPDGRPGAQARPSVASLLHRAVRAERRRVGAWLLAGAVTAAGALALASAAGALLAGLMGLGLAAWSARQVVALHLARRDFQSADTPPRRAYVMLLHDPNPKAFRPLLAVWERPPAPRERLPKPQSVWRCDDELTELACSQASVVVHEAWLDTGPRSWSKPRWACADAGIVVPHRRALLGRWYVSMLVRSSRPGDVRRLTLGDPHAVPQTAEELPLDGSLLRSVAGRIVLLAGFTAVVLALA
jgi:hypothetical protein